MQLKSLFTTLAFAFVMITSASAQFEIKLNPIGAIFSSPDVSVEYGVVPSFGVEGTMSLDFGNYSIGEVKYKNRGFGLRFSGKYYFSPDSSIDRWYAGVYTKFRKGKATISDETGTTGPEDEIKSTRLAVGILFGHKWVTKHNLVFELNAGFGRAFVANFKYGDDSEVSLSDFPFANWDFVGTFAIGYRFGDKNN